jgi:uncharacterized protein YdhG (YjbR/CyaY superfamily)
MRIRPGTFDEYPATVNDDQRATPEKLRKIIRAAAPKAEESLRSLTSFES